MGHHRRVGRPFFSMGLTIGLVADERMLIFATIENLRRLSEATTWYMDGNFAMAPNHFAQLYVIIAGFGESALPAVFVLLQRKTQATYEHMMAVLQEKVAERLEMYLNPNKIILDFEIAVINAIGAVLGNGITIKCCSFIYASQHSTNCKNSDWKIYMRMIKSSNSSWACSMD